MTHRQWNEMSSLFCFSPRLTRGRKNRRGIFNVFEHSENISEWNIVERASQSSVNHEFAVTINDSAVQWSESGPCFGFYTYAGWIQLNLKIVLLGESFRIKIHNSKFIFKDKKYLAIFLHWSCNLEKLAAKSANCFWNRASFLSAWAEGYNPMVHVVVLNMTATCYKLLIITLAKTI